MSTTFGLAFSFLLCVSLPVKQGKVRSCEALTILGLVKEGDSRKVCRDIRVEAALVRDSVLDNKSWESSAGCRLRRGTRILVGERHLLGEGLEWNWGRRCFDFNSIYSKDLTSRLF